MPSTQRLFQTLKHPRFARLYAAQTINLVGDAFTWLGLALLAFELAGDQAGLILSSALTVRVAAYVVLSPLAGAIADRVDRKQMMVATHLARMGLVCLFPFVTQPWQIYGIVLLLNGFAAFFTPTYKATIPLVTPADDYPRAIALSSATYQLLGILGPGIAGGVAALVGTRQVFFLDGLTFLVAAMLLVSLPGNLRAADSNPANPQDPVQSEQTAVSGLPPIWPGIRTGTLCLFQDPLIRYGLLMQLVAAIAGAAILVNTIGYVQGTLQLGQIEYGWVMAAFGFGATVAALGLGSLGTLPPKTTLASLGALLIVLTLMPANWVGLIGLLLLWSLAGAGQTLVNVPTQTLIADRMAVEIQGRVYGAHFAWSHLWWAVAYPLAGGIGSHWPRGVFLGSGLVGLALWGAVSLVFRPRQQPHGQAGLWHDHSHRHDHTHQHAHGHPLSPTARHRHPHFHPSP